MLTDVFIRPVFHPRLDAMIKNKLFLLLLLLLPLPLSSSSSSVVVRLTLTNHSASVCKICLNSFFALCSTLSRTFFLSLSPSFSSFFVKTERRELMNVFVLNREFSFCSSIENSFFKLSKIKINEKQNKSFLSSRSPTNQQYRRSIRHCFLFQSDRFVKVT